MIDWLKPLIQWVGRIFSGLSAFLFGWKTKEAHDEKEVIQAATERRKVDDAVERMPDDTAVIELSKWTKR
jgi:hypothetical protein